MPVVVAHERLGRPQDAFLRIIEGGGDNPLELQRQLVGGFVRVIMQFIADAMEKIVGSLEFAIGACC